MLTPAGGHWCFDSVALKIDFSAPCERQAALQPTFTTACGDALRLFCQVFFLVGVHKGILKVVDDKAMKTITRRLSGAPGQKIQSMMA